MPHILVLGNGGREHALAWACAKSGQVSVATGNAGTADEAGVQNIALDIKDHAQIIDFCQKNAVDFVLVGPEAPLVAGIVDDLRAHNIKAWGPIAQCAQLEGSKSYAKAFMQKHNIPTASYAVFDDVQLALDYLSMQNMPIVIKADGLAAGKGVVVAQTLDDATNAVRDMLSDNKFGVAGARVVIEAFLQGEEASFICMVDGKNILPMATSQDHKRVFENDLGDNTGGMGAYSPAPIVTQAVHDKVMARIIRPVVQAMADNDTPYTGFLYAGLMIDKHGDPYVVEFNCRFGDPETQPIMMRLKTPLVDLIQAGLDGNLPSECEWDERPALGVVIASHGYPQNARTGDPIQIHTEQSENLKIFHAGTTYQDGVLVSSGGRVLCATAIADDVAQAQQIALGACDKIVLDGAHYRRDIGRRAL